MSVGQKYVGQMSSGQMSVSQISVGQMCIGQLSVNLMSASQMAVWQQFVYLMTVGQVVFDQYMWNLNTQPSKKKPLEKHALRLLNFMLKRNLTFSKKQKQIKIQHNGE
jgi:hypothetical protein